MDRAPEHFKHQKELATRDMRITAVSEELGMSVTALNTMIKHGRLAKTTASWGYRTITKVNLKGVRRRRFAAPSLQLGVAAQDRAP